ncbi:hypothetical protein [Maricaulis sp.]|uniref:hypothetical protein n=1 Tax=Maricaulis sp. TaxID=1486257 RepID=UPI003A8FF007
MRRFQGVMAAVCACGLISACASDPISLVGTDASEISLRSNPLQADLLDAAQALETTYRDNAWAGTSGAMEAARGWMDRLTGRSETPAAPAVPVVSAGQAYVEHRQFLVIDAREAGEAFVSDVEQAVMLARHLDQAARAVTLQPTAFRRAALTRDLNDVETAIGLTREAVDTFDAAVELLSERVSETDIAAVNSSRDQLAFLSESLRDRADELARMRRDLRNLPPFS